MGSTFNPQILMEKLAKLNSSQQSIETLSHWCIFHMNKAKNVVETWARQFHSSPRDQRLAFLYLSNDILQNSRRKGSEFVGEFWKVLPDALRDVIENGDEFGRNAAIRLINIWEERKVFGSRGQLLKEELVGRKLDTSNRNGNPQASKLINSAGNALDKIVSGYEIVYGSQLDEDAILSKCTNAISCVDKVDKEIGGDIRSVQLNGSGIVEEIKGQHAILTDCIEQLTTMESSRANLVFHLRQTLQEQEFKLDQVRSKLQAAQSQSALAENLCKQILNTKETQTSKGPQSYISGSGEQTAPVMYTRQGSFADKPAPFEDNPKSTAAAVAAQLTASTSSAQMLTYVLSSLASEGVISNNTMNESSNDYPPEKKARREKEHAPYVPCQNPQPPAPQEQPPPPSSPPPMPPPLPPMQPYPVPQFTQSLPYSTVGAQYSVSSPFPVPPPNSYQNYQPEGGFYGQPSSSPMAPVSRQ